MPSENVSSRVATLARYTSEQTGVGVVMITDVVISMEDRP